MEENTVAKQNTIRKDVVWNLIGQFSYLFGLWVITMLTTKFIGFEAQGVLSLALVAGNICTSVANYYLRLQYASDIYGRFKDGDYVFARFALTLISFVVCVGYCFALQYSLATILSIMLFYVYKAFEMLSDIYQGVLQRHGKLYLGGYTMTAKGILSVGVFLLIAKLTANLDFALIGIAVVAAAIFVIDVLLTKKVAGFAFKTNMFQWGALRKLLVLCFPLFLLHLGCNVLPSLPRIFFEKIYDQTQLGYYASIANIAVLIQTAASAAMIPLVPRISKLYSEGKTASFLKFCGVVMGIWVALGGIACIIVHFAGDWALKLVYGEEIAPYTYTFLLTTVAAIATALVIVATQILGAMEKRLWAALALGIGTVVCAAISYPLCTNQYMNGISLALIISEGVSIIAALMVIWFFRKAPEKQVEKIDRNETR